MSIIKKINNHKIVKIAAGDDITTPSISYLEGLINAINESILGFADLVTNGLLVKTGETTVAARTITGTSNQVTVTNGDGVSGNPTLSLPQDIATTSSPTFDSLNLSTGWLLDSSGLSDGEYNGIIRNGTAGENLSKYNVLYPKNSGGVLKWYKYSAESAFGDKDKPPRAMAMETISSGSSGVILTYGIVRNDSFGFTSNQDEGKLVYASETAGGIALSQPSGSGDIVVIVGSLEEENILFFNPQLLFIEI